MFHNYHHIISVGNLFLAWREFVRGKKKRDNVTKRHWWLIAYYTMSFTDLCISSLNAGLSMILILVATARGLTRPSIVLGLLLEEFHKTTVALAGF
ncbi:MAG: hypothetical protein U9M92_02030 [Patescibacteria group bacterium]|nr:hypothetical protein [Patescibacteria group bacterium]